MANRLRACMVGSDEEDEDGNLSEINPKSPSRSEASHKGVVDLSDDTSSLQEKEEKRSKNAVPVLDLCSDTNDSDIQIVGKKNVKIKEENDDKKLIKLKPEEEDVSVTDELIVESIENDVDDEDEDEALGSLEDDEDEMSPEDDEDADEDCEINTDDEEMSNSDSDFEITKKKSSRKKPTSTKKTVTKNLRKSKFIGSNKKSVVIANEEDSEDSSSSSSQSVDDEDEASSLNKKFIRQKTPICDSIMNDCITQAGKKTPEKESVVVPNTNDDNKENSLNATAISSDKDKVNEKSDSFHAVIVDSNDSKMEQGEVETSGSDPLSVKIKEEIKEEITDENKDDIKLFSTEDTTGEPMDCDDSQEGLTEKETCVEDNNLGQKVRPNKRKRASKKNEEVLEPTYSISNVKSCTKTQPINESSLGTEAVKKRRGRPPRKNLSTAQNCGESEEIPDKKARSSLNKSISDAVTTESLNLNASSNDSQPTTTRKRGRASKSKAAESLGLLNASLDSQPPLSNNPTDLGLVTRLPSSDLQSAKVTSSFAETMTSYDKVSLVADYAISYQKVFDESFFLNILPLLSEIVMLCMDEFTELLDRQKKAESFTSEELRQQEIGLAKKSFWTMVATYSETFFPNFNSVMYKINQTKLKRTLMVALLVFIANTLQTKAPKLRGSFHRMRKVLMCMFRISKENDIIFCDLLMTNENTFNGNLIQSIKLLLILNKSDILSLPHTALSVTSSGDNLQEISESIFSSITNTVLTFVRLGLPDNPLPKSSVSKNPSSFKISEIAAQFVNVLKNKRPNNSKKMEEKLNLILSMLEQTNQESNSASLDKGVKSSQDRGSCNISEEGSLLVNFEEMHNKLDENCDETQVGGLDKLLEFYLKSTSSADDVKPDIIDLDFESEESDQLVLKSQITNDINNTQSDDVKVEEVDCANLSHFQKDLIQSENCNYLTDVPSEQDPLSF